MFAGLPGIGVGTLFYVLIALCMPVVELANVVRGTSSLARWRRIRRQWIHAVSIVVSIMVAERVLLFILGQAGPESLNPARLLNRELMNHAPQSFLAAPLTASLLIVGTILLTVEVANVVKIVRRTRQARDAEAEPVFSSEVLNSPPGS
jgi:hypothetical protein